MPRNQKKRSTKALLHRDFRAANTALRQSGATYCIWAGTCLGAIREGRFLANEHDIDFAVIGTDAAADIETRLVADGFRVDYRLTTPDAGCEIMFTRGDIWVDVYFMPVEGDRVLYTFWVNGNLLVFGLDAKPFMQPKAMQFAGETTYAPNPPEAYLAEQYGEDWATVRPDWTWRDGPYPLRKTTPTSSG